jgi:hypothetical protein
MHARVGDLGEPAAELGIEIVEIAEAACQEEVLADVAERPLDLPLRLGPVRPAGLRQIAIVGARTRPASDSRRRAFLILRR